MLTIDDVLAISPKTFETFYNKVNELEQEYNKLGSPSILAAFALSFSENNTKSKPVTKEELDKAITGKDKDKLLELKDLFPKKEQLDNNILYNLKNKKGFLK